MKLPQSLLSSIRDGSVVLYLGHRVFEDAVHPRGEPFPNQRQLSKLLSQKFLNGKYETSRIETILEFCELQHGTGPLQRFLYDLFCSFRPSEQHLSITRIPWKAIVTIDISLLLEQAFAKNPDSPVKLASFHRNGQRVDDELVSHRHIPFLKLRGTIAEHDNDTAPAPFVEQWPLGVAGRERLLERVSELALDHPMLFIGNSYEDSDMASAIRDFCTGRHPRSYAVLQSIGDLETQVLQRRGVETIKCSSSEFFRHLEQQTEQTFHALAPAAARRQHAIDRHLRLPIGSPTPDAIANFLEATCTYVHPQMSSEPATPRAFYRGMSYGWNAVLSLLDVRRQATGNLVVSVCLGRVSGKEDAVEMILIKGSAGCGKSVFLKRVALECSEQDSIICLYDERLDAASFRTLAEIYRLSKKRIALFFDNAAQKQNTIAEYIRRATDLCIPLTIVTTERHGRWNVECARLHSYEWREFKLGNLNEDEIRALIGLLDKHNCLGVLKHLAPEQRVRRLSEYAERQLLVALHEVTMGISFEQIIVNEYRSISDPEAQALYRTICICHRYGIPVRAGLISRIHNIPFERFKAELFSPLEEIVFAPMDQYNFDHVYKSRHQDIAKIVFEQVIARHETRLSEYRRLIGALDVDYTIDREALISLTRSRDLLDIFDRRSDLEQIYNDAAKRVDAAMQPFLLQQMAIMEMRFSGGSLDKAEMHIQAAQRLAPRAQSIAHTASEIARQRTLVAQGDAQKSFHKTQALRMVSELLERDPWDEFAVHTYLKILQDELSDVLASPKQEGMISLMGRLEEQMDRALQKFPDSPVILESDARFRRALNQNDKALKSLRAAVRNAPDRVFYIKRLAQVEFDMGEVKQAITTLESAIKRAPSGVETLHEELARILQIAHPEQRQEIAQHLRKAFTLGGSRLSAHYKYAVYEFLHGDKVRAGDVFRVLRDSEVPFSVKRKIRDTQEDLQRQGSVNWIDFSVAHVSYAGASILAPCSESDEDEWQKLRRGSKVKFTLAFQYTGPLAVRLVSI